MNRMMMPLAFTAAALCTAGAAHAAPKAKITPRQAEAAALKRVPGTPQSATYEFEDGRWQYAVLVNGRRGGLHEVEVDAASGRVTDTEKTTPGEEAREAAADKKAGAKSEAGEKGEASDGGEAGG